MKPKDNSSPEEKLLNLIRKSKAKHTKQDQAKPDNVSSVNKSQQLRSKAASPRKDALEKSNIVFSGLASINFVIINKLIILLFIVILSLFFYDFYFNNTDLSYSITRPSREEKISLEEKEVKPFSYYQKEISKRNLFQGNIRKTQSKRVIPVGATFKDLVKNLSLLGIVSGEQRRVIIEDKKMKKTYFLYEGDFVSDIKIEEIYPDRVILEYKGEKISLFI